MSFEPINNSDVVDDVKNYYKNLLDIKKPKIHKRMRLSYSSKENKGNHKLNIN